MKVAFFTGVAALVAGQPYPIQVAPPQNDLQGPCWNIAVNAQCCLPNGCNLPPRYPWMRPPPPPYQFLTRVCCEEGKECCPDDFYAYQPTYSCCDSNQYCEITDNKGTCKDGIGGIGSGMTPGNQPDNKLDATGHCPGDQSLPILQGPNLPFTCSLNILIPNRRICPQYTKCVKDRQSNVNTGVCCFDSGCGAFTTCKECVEAERPNTYYSTSTRGCSWLSQGNILDKNPVCVSGCEAFPGKSCVLTGRSELCPKSSANPDGLEVNTGSCAKRCGMVGTGRSSGINNDGNKPQVDPNVEPTECCGLYPADYCCSAGQLADHCLASPPIYVPPNAPSQFPPIRPGFPRCGTPVRGTPNTLFNTPRPPPIYAPYPYYPPAPYWGRPNPWFREYGSFEDDKEAAKAAALEEEKQWFFTPWTTIPVRPPPYRPPPPRYPPLHVVDQRPSEFICSCDADCLDKYDDCCTDYTDICVQLVPAPLPAP